MGIKKIIVASIVGVASVGTALTLTFAVDWRKNPDVTSPIANQITYNGEQHELIQAATTTGGTIQYALGTETESAEEYSCDIPTAVNAGVYYVWYKVVGDEKKFHDVEPSNVIVTINKAKAEEPTLTTSSFTFDGTEKEVELSGVESYMTKSNDSVTKASAKGEYTITYSLDSNHEWNAGSDGVIKWSIGLAQTTITVDQTPIVKTYGEAITIPTATSNFGTVNCDKKASDLVNAGTYTITYTVEGTDNYTSDTKTVSVTINKKEIVGPTLSGTYTYNGSEQSVTINNFDSTTMEYANDSVNKATDAGTYKVKVNPKDSSNYKWDSTFNGELEWVINKATPVYTIPAAAEGLVYNAEYQSSVSTVGTVNDSNSYHWEFKLLNYDTMYYKDIRYLINAGTYTIYYKLIVTSNNYTDPNIEACFDVTVAKVTPTVTTPTGYNLQNNSSHQTLCSSATTNYGVIWYRIGGYDGGPWQTPPQGLFAGTYNVYYWVVGNENINDVAEQYVTCYINP